MRFNKSMIVPANLTRVNDTVLELTVKSLNDHFIEENLLGLAWKVKNFTESNMTLQITWDNPAFISQHTIRDKLVLKVIDPNVLFDNTDFLAMKNRTITTINLPP